MDLVFIAGSLALSPYLPRHLTYHADAEHLASKNQLNLVPTAISASAATSFLLLSLSVLEAIPSSWMILLRASLLPTAYRLLFTIIVWLVFVILPFIVGTKQQLMLRSVFQRKGSDAEETKKQRLFNGNKGLHNRIFWALVCIVRFLLRAICSVAFLPALRIFRKKDKGPILATVSSPRRSKSDTNSPSTETTPSSRTALTGGILGILLLSCILRILGPWVVRTTDETPILTVGVAWLTAVGLLLSACINGFGSVSMPHSCMAGFYLKPIPPEAIARAQEEVQQVARSLQQRKDLLDSSTGIVLPPGAPASVSCKRSSFSDIGEDVISRRKKLQTEIDFLETVAEMKDEVKEMHEMQELAAGARTPLGRCKLWLGVVFSAILVIRLFSAAIFLWNHNTGGISPTQGPRKSGSDPITMILLWLLGQDYVTQQDYNTLSQFISCVMTGILSLSQVRTFWRTIIAVNRRLRHVYRKVPCVSSCRSRSASIRKTHNKSSGVYENIVACLMGCYFLSCIVLTKLMLPPDYRAAFADALGDDIDSIFRIRSYSVNLTFTLSATTTAFFLGVFLGIQRQNTVRHLSGWKTTNSDQPVEP